MIGTAFAPEPLPDADVLRKLIREHRVSHQEVLACRCALFYQEALSELHFHSVEQVNVVRACMEALLSASQCMVEYRAVLSDSEQSRSLGSLAVYGFIQALTQIVESVTGLEESLNIDIRTVFPKKTASKSVNIGNSATGTRTSSTRASLLDLRMTPILPTTMSSVWDGPPLISFPTRQ